MVNEALCLALSYPAPTSPSVGPLSPLSRTREYYLFLSLLGEGKKSLGNASPLSPSSALSEPGQLWLYPDLRPLPPKKSS